MNKKQLRQQRRKQLEAEQKKQARQQKVLWVFGAVLLAAALLGVILLFISREEKQNSGSGEIEALLRGIPQQGLRIGNPEADLVLIEWADLQCPACRDFTENYLPEIIRSQVRTGKVQIELRQWPILGADSTKAAKAALAASLQNRYWQFVEYFYANQGTEGTGYVTDDFLEEIARLAKVPDLDRWRSDQELPRWEKELLRNDEEAILFQFSGTPSFAAGPSAESAKPLDIAAPEDLLRRLEDLGR